MLNFLRQAADWLHNPSSDSENGVEFRLFLEKLWVGSLSFQRGLWIFEYSDEFKKQSEIRPIMDFPVLERRYESKDLWPFFALRIPSREQVSVKSFLETKESGEVDEATMLRQFGRRSVANPFELQPG